ncbi:hypothetical protein F2Q69_00043955 [Brassica cretica]|uniref:Uncharacterized protein n=1 Tax=Brassica cretica TaxID=69181 RepID=A0A8S9NPG5_BRACR|nr:hypothetical protein F2Q69_00043955 [Brassica cretica]
MAIFIATICNQCLQTPLDQPTTKRRVEILAPATFELVSRHTEDEANLPSLTIIQLRMICLKTRKLLRVPSRPISENQRNNLFCMKLSCRC